MQISDIQYKISQKFPNIEIQAQPNAIIVPQASVLDIARYLKEEEHFENCHCITAVDRKDRMEVVYHLYSTPNRLMLTLKSILPYNDLNVHTVCGLWKSANWLEREVFDLFGINFIDHPDMRRIMNPDNWTDHPLRKDFKRDDFIPRPSGMGGKG